MPDRYFIQTSETTEREQLSPLLSTLERLLPVNFGFSAPAPEQPVAGVNVLTAKFAGGEPQHRGARLSTLSVARAGDASRPGELIDVSLVFSDDANVAFPFRGRSLRTKVSVRPNALSLRPNERPLAVCEHGPVWAVSEEETAKHFRSGFALPALPADGGLADVLNGGCFLEMVVLLHWLRDIGAGSPPGDSPLRACFIFDDPNLHWPRYGFVDYRHLAAQAEKENYHVSFATIPLDAWFTHDGTAELFRTHRNRLSLLVHGNNHTKWELAQPYSEAERLLLLRQAVRRIERLERQSGVAVARVMVPPHGACSEEMLAALPACGFAAACISHGSLRAHNKAKAWTKALGLRPFERVRGCPVLPRWAISANVKNTILLAAFLGQAIVLRGHHQDLKDGVELLGDAARFINGLGPVVWSDMGNLSRSIVQGREPSGDDVWPSPRTDGRNGDEIAWPPASMAKAYARRVPAALVRRWLTEARDRLLR